MQSSSHDSFSAQTNVDTASPLAVICRVGDSLFAVPLAHVIETMRPQPIAALATPLSCVLGLSVIRGVPRPVVDAAALLGAGNGARFTRFVAIRAGDRQVMLAVEEVLGVRELTAATLGALPPLLDSAPTRSIAAVGVLDAELVVVLQSTRVLPQAAWPLLEEQA
jgi:purine-binding chemotaxis protein CheW